MLVGLAGLFAPSALLAQHNNGEDPFAPYNHNPFRQLNEELPTANRYRAGDGAPGPDYWQQRADYVIDVTLDDERQRITGEETITYYNNSPLPLTYLWVQLDQNVRAKNSDTYKVSESELDERMSFQALERLQRREFEGGYKIGFVKDGKNRPMEYTINKTMMRIDLPEPLEPGDKTTFSIQWSYNINNQPEMGGRSGYEFFEADSNYLYEIAQWFPRMCVYNDHEGWQNKQFLGRGEFALTFGNYEVRINVPEDHIVASTGTLQNPKEVLTSEQRNRLEQAYESFDEPVLIVTEDEARQNEQTREKGRKTWVFKAENVRDFAWASSRKFVWDAMAVKLNGRTILAQSYYPKEGNPLWGQYSTQVVAHTIRIYSKHTIDYPYPQCTSVHGPVWGMEYPMLSFNGGRPDPDGTYSPRIKYAMISVIIHEVGHNWFPMIINSDERQWTWMDEGLNTFCQFLAEQEWQRDYPSRRGFPEKMVPYMKGSHETQTPIMTNSESIYQFGNNAYGKPATALNILRETVMGRELFDYAFKEYARRWAFCHPEPADFFRTMEDASGVDLDWFWRGWFYSTHHTDISIESVRWYTVDTRDPEIEFAIRREEEQQRRPNLTQQRNLVDIQETLIEQKPELKDFYNEFDPYEVRSVDLERYERYYETLDDDQKALLTKSTHYYELTFKNIGGLVMPLIVEFEFEDGTTEEIRIPAEIWRKDWEEVTKVFVFSQPVERIVLDPHRETADTDLSNNLYPREIQPSRFQLFRQNQGEYPNPMREAREAEQED